MSYCGETIKDARHGFAVWNIEDEQVVSGWCGARTAFIMLCELKMVALARQTEHDARISRMAFESADLLQAYAVMIKPDDLSQLICRARDSDLSDG